jgi:hypothetical protein
MIVLTVTLHSVKRLCIGMSISMNLHLHTAYSFQLMIIICLGSYFLFTIWLSFTSKWEFFILPRWLWIVCNLLHFHIIAWLWNNKCNPLYCQSVRQGVYTHADCSEVLLFFLFLHLFLSELKLNITVGFCDIKSSSLRLYYIKLLILIDNPSKQCRNTETVVFFMKIEKQTSFSSETFNQVVEGEFLSEGSSRLV